MTGWHECELAAAIPKRRGRQSLDLRLATLADPALADDEQMHWRLKSGFDPDVPCGLDDFGRHAGTARGAAFYGIGWRDPHHRVDCVERHTGVVPGIAAVSVGRMNASLDRMRHNCLWQVRASRLMG
ncbi:MAG: hypothetical protein ABSG76_03990 [Xanthobacteraceae bacterium]